MKNNHMLILALCQVLPLYLMAFSGGPKQLISSTPCAFTINEGQDITICEPGQNINLGVSVDGPYLNASWTPSAGLSNPNSPTTNAIVNQTTTYTLTVSGLGSSNLIYNGDFNLGLTGFTSNYVPGTGGTWGPLSAEGTFAVSTNSNLTHTQFANCTDHTGGGSMLVVNGAGVPNQNVWCQTVAVTPGTAYSFSMWATSVVSAAPAILQISINGSLLGSPFQLPSATCQWNQFFQLWNSGASTTATICIVNQNTQVGGNDFALDDIAFGPVCQETTEVTITVEEVNASWTPPTDLCPFSPGFSLDALLQPGATPGGTWTVNGAPAIDFNPALLGPGTFSVSYTVTSLNCTESVTQDILIELLPAADFTVPDVFCSTEPPIDPDSWLLPTTPTSGQWTVNGNPVTTFSPALLGPGLYTVVYTTGVPPCINSQSQTIEVVDPPNASWSPPSAFCQNAPSFNLNDLLDPEATPGGQWDVLGTLVTEFNPNLLGPGSYAVTYQVGVFPCNASYSTFIIIDPLPIALWTGPDTLCTNAATVNLNDWLDFGSTSGGDWSINGQPAVQFNPSDFMPGWQIITYQVGADDCMASHTDSVYIQATINAPVPTCTQITASTVLITWPDVSGALSFNTQIISGQTAEINNQDTLYFTGLGIGESVRVLIFANSPGPCQPVASDTLTCMTPLCGTFPIMFSPVDTLCFSANMDTLTLVAEVDDPTGLGNGVWSGAGIIDSINGLFNPNLAGEGVHTVYYTYDLNDCLSNDSLQIVILPTPVANFQLPPTACSSDETLISFTGTASNQAVFSWFFDDANVLSGSGRGPFTLSWPSSGQRVLSLSIVDGPCSSGLFRDTIYVAPAIDSFVVTCLPGQTQISYRWNRLPDSVQVTALVTMGPTGSFTSDTSYVITGLNPGQAVVVRFTAIGTGVCPNQEVTVNCNALTCALVDVQIVPRDTICVPATSILMQATVTNGSPFGTLTWSGENINPVTGRWMPSTDWIGLTIPIWVTYTEGPCSVTDSIFLPIQRKPKPNFTASSPVCQDQPSILQYLGDAMSTATFNWDFSGDPTVTPAGPGTFQLTWSEPGVYPLFLVVNENGCDSDPYGVVVRVDQLIEVPQVACFPTASSIDFVWRSMPPPTAFQTTSTSFHAINMLSDTSLRVQNLQPSTAVTILVRALSNSACPNTETTITCQTDACPAFSFDINPIAPICWSGSPQQIQLSTTGLPNPAPGQLVWSGPGIVNAQTGLWESNPGMAGQTISVIAAYTTGFCTYRDTLAISVLAPPEAIFSFGTNPVCFGENATVIYNGNAGNTATFNWNFGTANAIPGNGEGPHVLSFPAAGSYPVSLQVTENGCTSQPYTISIVVSPPTPVPVISCVPGVSTVSFSWNQLPGVSGFTPTLLSGQSLEILSDTSVLVSGLMPEESVSIQVLVLSNGSCPDTMATLTCATTVCDDIPMSIAPVNPVCWDGTPTEINLELSGLPSDAAGQLSWSGPGIVDAADGLWRTEAGMAGLDIQVIATYVDGFCTLADTLSIRVNQTPLSAIGVSDTLVCVNDPVTLSFTGNTGANALFQWNFGGLTGTPGTGAGPHQLSTGMPGNYTVSLHVAENGCVGNLASATIRVEAPLGLPQPVCNADYNAITFSWPSVSGAVDYLASLPAGFSGSWLSPNSFQVTGLLPATSVNLALTAVSNGVCPNTTTNISCSTLSCPTVSVSLQGQTLICAGDSARVTVSIVGPPNTRVNLSLSNGLVLPNIGDGYTFAFLPSQTTTVQVLNVNSLTLPFCPVSAPAPITIIVEQPPFAGIAAAEFSVCALSDNQFPLESLLSMAQSGGFWSTASGSSIPASGSFQAATGIFNTLPNTAGLYQFVYTLPGTSVCPGDTTTVSVRLLPLPEADAGPDRTINCNEATVSIGSVPVGNLLYQWFDQTGNLIADADATIPVGTPGTYRLVVTNPETSCADEDIVVVLPGTPLPDAVINTNPVSCFGDADGIVQIGSVSGGVEPLQFSINGGPYTTQTTYPGLEPGVYTITIRDAIGCETTLITQLQQPVDIQAVLDPIGLDIDPTLVRLGDSLRLVLEVNVPESQLASIRWLPYPCDDCTSLSILPLQSDAFQVVVTDTNGCVASASLQVLLDRTPAVYIPNAFSPNNDGQNDVLHIFAGKMVSRVNYFAIYDRWGERVFEAQDFQPNDPAYGWDGMHRTTPMQSAVFVYYAEIETIDGTVHLLKGDVTLIR
jgi:gliding motility-associated-like protein